MTKPDANAEAHVNADAAAAAVTQPPVAESRGVVAYIGIGANLGDAYASVKLAITQLAQLADSRPLQHSSLYRSAPFEADGGDYLNAVAAITTTLPPLQLLAALQAIELAFGRERPYFHAPRTLDLDLLLYGDQQIALPDLTVPHPGVTLRAFVLLPLLEINPALLIPGVGAAKGYVTALGEQRIERLI
jgi:2-amino-4-hydroxy-6-hydroxymethyldihydropteridine diphosphokinase